MHSASYSLVPQHCRRVLRVISPTVVCRCRTQRSAAYSSQSLAVQTEEKGTAPTEQTGIVASDKEKLLRVQQEALNIALAASRGMPAKTEQTYSVHEWEKGWDRWIKDNQQWQLKLIQQQPKMVAPTRAQRHLLVWLGVYAKLEHVPALVSSFAVRKHVSRQAHLFAYSVLFLIFTMFMYSQM